MRMPVMGLPEWRRAVDCFVEDGSNTLVLWMPGGFRSKKFPLTWGYNAEHANVRQDFVRELIDYAHTRGIRVLLGFTPFGYDGVNQMPLEHPGWKAEKADGSPVDEFGIHSWGWSLCPAQAEVRDFMREYLREMIFDFYLNADGLMVESSDYNVCQCADCRARPYEEEFKLTREISSEMWKVNPEALILVYPHYFTGRKVPGLETAAVRQPFDPRWSLVFTPHSAHFDSDLIRQAKGSIFSGPEAVLGTPATISAAAQSAKKHGVNGYLPSLEAFSYPVTRAEGGEPFFIGRRRQPLGLDPEKEGRMPYNSLLCRVQRLAVREFSREPGLPFGKFKQILSDTFFPGQSAPQAVADLLELQRIFNFEADWYWSSPLLDPAFFKARSQRLNWPAEKLAAYQRNLDRLKEIAARYQNSSGTTERGMFRLSDGVVKRWADSRISP
ncbi:MAG: hypothetical protein V4726_16005 [Verrucomicrobiota bacterium]